MVKLSIILVSFRSWNKLSECLDSLEAIDDSRFLPEVIVVDNCSDDGKLDEFRNRYAGFRFLLNSGNNGFANGCNLGARHSTGDLLLFLNPDTVVNAESLYAMVCEVSLHRSPVVVSCSQVKSNGRKERPYGTFLSLSTLTGWMRVFARAGSAGFRQDDRIVHPDWVSGSVVMMKRVDFEQVGGWDDSFWMYYEDVDLCKRVRETGGDVVLLLNFSIIHNHGGSSRINKQVTAITKTEVNISRHLYISKHADRARAFLMHLILIADHLIIGLLPALLGLLFFFLPSVNVRSHIYFRLLKYYLSVPFRGSWKSPRSLSL